MSALLRRAVSTVSTLESAMVPTANTAVTRSTSPPRAAAWVPFALSRPDVQDDVAVGARSATVGAFHSPRVTDRPAGGPPLHGTFAFTYG